MKLHAHTRGALGTAVLVWAALVIRTSLALAQSPYLVGDLTPGGVQYPFLDAPSELNRIGERVLFQFGDHPNGIEPWVSDGTADGTSLLADLCPGPVCHSYLFDVTVDGSQAIFVVEQPGSDNERKELWRTDGTGVGTYRLRVALYFKAIGSGPGGFLFSQSAQGAAAELWLTDGAPAGTRMLATLPGTPGLGYRLGEEFLFFAPGVSSGPDLWSTDGTPEGTGLLKELANSYISPTLVGLGDIAVFAAAEEALTLPTLWRSDGTVIGTYEVAALRPSALFAAGSQAFFYVLEDDVLELWRTDGASAGTRKLREFPRFSGYSSSVLSVREDVLLFKADDGNTGMEIWRSDGTVSGTSQVVDLCPGACSSDPYLLANGPGGEFLVARDGSTGLEPWYTDGTAPGTIRLRDTVPGPTGQNFFGLGVVEGRAVFMNYNDKLWSSDGTPAGTRRLPNLTGYTPDVGFEWVTTDSAILFPVENFSDSSWWLWRTDGTSGGTRAVARLNPDSGEGSRPSDPQAFDDEVFFLAGDQWGAERLLYRSDGSSEGTSTVGLTRGGSYSARRLKATQDRLFVGLDSNRVVAGDGSSFSEVFDGSRTVRDTEWGTLGGDLLFMTYPEGLWKADGAGSVLLDELSASYADGGPGYFLALGDRVVFPAEDYPIGGFWTTDGTAMGTTLLFEAESVEYSNEQDWVVLDGNLYFYDYLSRLWVSDGSAGAPTLVVDIEEDVFSYEPLQMTVMGDRFFFSEAVDGAGQELWMSDGTAEGTQMVLDLWPGAGGSHPRGLTPQGGRLFFSADHPDHGRELWVTDGTSTELVRDLWPGTAGGSPQEMLALDSGVLFSASDGRMGHELWYSDGTLSGTLRLPEIAAGPSSSLPHSFVRQGDLVLFAAHDGLRGEEPWGIRISEAIGPILEDGFESGGFSAWSSVVP